MISRDWIRSRGAKSRRCRCSERLIPVARGTPSPTSAFRCLEAMRLNTDCLCRLEHQHWMHRDRRSHDGRHSTTANGRSSLTFLAPAPTFQPNREQLVCDDTDGRLISRFFSAPSQVPRRRPASHLVPMAPGLPLARRFDLFSQFTVVRRALHASRIQLH